MAYSTALPGIEEATRDAVVALIQGAIPSLNTVLGIGGPSPALAMSWTTGQVVLGDSEVLAASRISVVAGGDEDALTMLTEAKYLPLTDIGGYQEQVKTNIFIYLHPDEFAGADADVQAASRNRVLDRITDHLRRRVFHDPSNVNLLLASKEHNTSGDILHTNQITAVRKSTTMKNYGGAELVHYAHLAHSGIIE